VTRRAHRRAWTPIPDALTEHHELPDGAYRLYVLLATYCWNGDDTCWPSKATLAHRLGVDPRTVHDRLDVLVGLGLVVKHPRRGKSSEYQLTQLAPRKPASGVGRNGASDEEHEPLSRKNTERLAVRSGRDVAPRRARGDRA
jgi:hypothetical protein